MQIRNFAAESRAQAYEELKKAVRELSGDPSVRPVSKPPLSLVLEQDRSNLSELDVTELYHLGHTWLEGIENELEPNMNRAYEIWSVAAQRGSIEAQYSLAVCLRQGKGVAKNAAEAFRMMDELAKAHNYGLAHVSTVCPPLTPPVILTLPLSPRHLSSSTRRALCFTAEKVWPRAMREHSTTSRSARANLS